MDWTKEQKAIIDYRNGTLLVSAAAGSGKTAVLVQRIIQWIVQDKKNIDEFLVVTFTRAAARQMKEKIRKALEQLILERPGDAHIIRQLALVHQANITTIDSFCKSIVDEHVQELEIDPSMRILDETEGALMQEDVLVEILEEAYRDMAEEMTLLHHHFDDLRENQKIMSMVIKIVRQASSFPYPEEWLEMAKKDFCEKDDLEQREWLKRCCKEIISIGKSIQQLPAMLYDSTQKNGKTKENLYGEVQRMEAFMAMENLSYGQIRSIFQNKMPAIAIKNLGLAEDENCVEALTLYKEGIKAIQGMCSFSLEELEAEQQEQGKVLAVLLELSRKFMQAYAKEKKAKKVIDFNDIEHMALKVLCQGLENGYPVPTEVAKAMGKNYVEIMIDEYQDSNELQETILTSLAKGAQGVYENLFMVGDVKQSIYRFRMARPSLFQGKYARFSGDLTKEGVEKKIELRMNFRSRKEVLYASNFFFFQLMQEELGGIQYNDDIKLVPGRSFAEGKVPVDVQAEVLMLDMRQTGKEDEGNGEDIQENDLVKEGEREIQEEELGKIELEAHLVVKRIKELVNGENPQLVWDESLSDYRPCQYGDIVILLRGVKDWAEGFCKVFMDADIPVFADMSKGYFDSVEIHNLLSVLRVIDNRFDDISMTAVLSSPLVGLTSSDLASLRMLSPSESMWGLIQLELNQETTSELNQRLSRFVQQLEEWKTKSTYCTIRQLIHEILRDTGYYEYLSAMPAGAIRQANVFKLIEKASDYEETEFKGLFNFLRYIDKVKLAGQDYGEARAQAGSDNMVHIMSIHKSKGLEFPVVFVSGCGTEVNISDSSQRVLIDADCYLATKKIDYEQRESRETGKYVLLKHYLRQDSIAEELRILYVAMTRAQEKLIFTGLYKGKKKEEEDILNQIRIAEEAYTSSLPLEFVKPIATSFIVKEYSYLDWILKGIHQGLVQNIDMSYLRYETVKLEDLAKSYLEGTLLEEETIVKKWEERKQQEPLEEYKKELDQRFLWEYTHPMAVMTKGKFSVSEIKKMHFNEEETDPWIQLFPEKPMQKKRKESDEVSAGAAYGTLMHLAMEKLSFTASSMQEITSGLQELVESNMMTQDEMKRIKPEAIFAMMHSELGERMAKAQEQGLLYKEKQFMLGMPIQEIYPECEEEETILIQGVIDAYFKEGEEYVIMDYKTDNVRDGEELLGLYRKQLQCYQYALEHITGKKVKAMALYSFKLNETIWIGE